MAGREAPERSVTRGGDPTRAALDEKVLTWMREPSWSRDDARFDALARELFAFQYERCDAYRRYCGARGRSPATVREWRDIPAVPAGSFKEVALRCFPEELERATFRTSGTSTTRRGELHLDTLALYEASLLPTIRRFLFPDLAADERMRVLVLAPAARALPDSSLSHMFACTLEAVGTRDSAFFVEAGPDGGTLLVDALVAALHDAARAGAPMALCGTAFAFVHLLEVMEAANETRLLPAGTRIMETGGFKGRRRELPRDELYTWIGRRLGVPSTQIVNQYGMTELGSQFYDSVLVEPGGPRRKLGPPWARVRLVDPLTGADAAPGAPGVITIHDLANTGSVAAVATADLGVLVEGVLVEGGLLEPGFEVLGREPGAEERGCSIAADVMLA